MSKAFSLLGWLDRRLTAATAPPPAPGMDRIALFAALASLLVSALLAFNHELINKDGILYVTVAQELLNGNWERAYWLFHWLFYPLFIAGISAISGLAVETSAHVLNALLAALMVWSFVAVLRELGASRGVRLAGALIILLHPYFNDWRPTVVREHGLYAFLMLSALFYLRYLKDPDWRHALLWFVTLGLATLFRIQGIVYFLLVPLLTALLGSGTLRTRVRLLSRPAILVGVPGMLLVLAGLLLGGMRDSPLIEPLMRIEATLRAFGGNISASAAVFAEQALNKYAEDYAVVGLVATLLIMVLDKAIGSLSFLYLILPLLAGRPAYRGTQRRDWSLIAAYALTGIAIAIGFVLSEQYVVSRYVAPFSLFALLAAPFAAVTLVRSASQSSHRAYRGFVYLLLLVFVGLSLDSLYQSPSANRYVRDGGEWVRNNLPPGARVYTNENRLAYYAGLELDWSNRNTGDIPGKQAWRDRPPLLPEGFAGDYDYLALALSRGDLPAEKAGLEQEPRIHLVQEIEGRRGGAVLVFEVRHQ